MNKRLNNIFVIVVTAFFLLFFFMLFWGNFRMKHFNGGNKEDAEGAVDSIDWVKLFPYDTTVPVTDYSTDINDSRRLDKLVSKVTDITAKFQNLGKYWAADMVMNEYVTKVGKRFCKAFRDPAILGEYVRLENGIWVEPSTSEISYKEAESKVVPYLDLQNYLKTEDIDFLYCMVPEKVSEYDNKLPAGIVSTENETADIYENALNDLGVNCLDFRDKIHEDVIDHYSLFYKTDHHWNIDAGIWAASVLSDEISELYGIPMVNVNDLGTYKRITYEDAMFGSEGQAVTHIIEKAEDFDILYPDFETYLRFEVPDKNIDMEGAFEEVLVDHEGLENDIATGGGYAYETLLYGNRPYEKITNYNNPGGPKILMIKDSYGLSVAPYLALSCSELLLLDTRPTNGNFTGSIVNCINGFKPDVVVVLQLSPPRQVITLNK